jgi:hypothetical protein
MGEPIQLAASRGASSESADILRTMAGQAERGEIISVTVMYERPDGSVGNWQSATNSRLRMAGALLDAAVRRLGYLDAD